MLYFGCDVGGCFDGRMLKIDLNFAQPVLLSSSSPRRHIPTPPSDTIIRAQPYPSEPQTCHLRSHHNSAPHTYSAARAQFCMPKLENNFSRNGFEKATASSGLLLGRGQGPYLCFKSSTSISLFFPLTLSYPSHPSSSSSSCFRRSSLFFRFFPLLYSLLNLHTFTAGQESKFSQQR